MKSKIIAALLACSVVFSGCSVAKANYDYNGEKMETYSITSENGFKIFHSALDKYSTSTKRDISNEVVLTVKTDTDGDISSSQTINYVVGEEKASFSMENDYIGQVSVTTGNYSDDYLYLEADGMKYKMVYSFEDFMKTIDNISMINLSEDAVSNTSIAKNGSDMNIELTFDGEKIKSLLDTDLSELRDYLGLSTDALTVSSMVVNAMVTPEYDVKSLDIDLNVEISDGEKNIPFEYKQTMTVNAIGDDTPAPADVANPDEYEDFSTVSDEEDVNANYEDSYDESVDYQDTDAEDIEDDEAGDDEDDEE